ncbi:uncharacterized protein, partial [Mytilus edulis]|uniref:uncharacterized protein n=1 Tax=Mytilus edulis TaxID=6550 RepID=UPI0039EF234B
MIFVVVKSTIGRERGRGRGRKRKRESSSDSNDDEDRIRIEESSSDEDETGLSPLLSLESTLMRENPGPSNMSKPGPSNAIKERLKKLYERSTTGRGKGGGKGRGRGMKRKRESSSDSSDSEEEIRPLDKNPRKKLFRKDIIEDSNDEKETDMTGLSPFLPLDSSLMKISLLNNPRHANVLGEELSRAFLFNVRRSAQNQRDISGRSARRSSAADLRISSSFKAQITCFQDPCVTRINTNLHLDSLTFVGLELERSNKKSHLDEGSPVQGEDLQLKGCIPYCRMDGPRGGSALVRSPERDGRNEKSHQ